MRSLLLLLSFIFLSQICPAQITMESNNGEGGTIELYAINSGAIPCTILLNFTSLDNLKASSTLVVASSGRSKVVTLTKIDESRSTGLQYSYSFVKGNYYGKTKEEPIYLIPLPEGTIASGIRMTHIENRLQPKEENTDYVGVSFRFGTPTEVVAPRKGVVSEISMGKSGDNDNLDFDRGENFIELYHEDGSLTKVRVLSPGSQKVKLGQVVFPGEVIAESAGEDYNSGFHVRLVNMKPVKDGTTKMRYEMTPMKFIYKDGESDISSPMEMEVVHPIELVTAEMSKKEKKTFEAGNQD